MCNWLAPPPPPHHCITPPGKQLVTESFRIAHSLGEGGQRVRNAGNQILFCLLDFETRFENIDLFLIVCVDVLLNLYKHIGLPCN